MPEEPCLSRTLHFLPPPPLPHLPPEVPLQTTGSNPPQRSKLYPTPRPLLTIKSEPKDRGERLPTVPQMPRWEAMLSSAASLYPVYVTVGGAVACVKPSAFSWFVERGPWSYSFTLGFIMLAMGLTLEFRDFFALLKQRPLSILFGCAAQYVIMPDF